MRFFKYILPILVYNLSSPAAHAQNLWTKVAGRTPPNARVIQSQKFSSFSTDETALKKLLFAIPATGQVVKLPLPDGSTANFRVVPASVLPEQLARKYPEIKTFTGISQDNPGVTAKLDYNDYGFHAMIFAGENTALVDPEEGQPGFYVAHYKKNEQRQWTGATHCTVQKISPPTPLPASKLPGENGARVVNGLQLRTYRLALACDHQYADSVTHSTSPTISQVLSKMVTTLNRVNGVYERELSVTMNLVDKEDTLIFNVLTGGPNGNDTFSRYNVYADTCIAINQIICDERIGSANYDVGHVFTTGAGGFSMIGVICNHDAKAMSVTGQAQPEGDGFDIDYVAHEMGHEFGGDHTFNSESDNCGNGNINPDLAYEPGSGSTIMAYAGICYPDDLQPHSDDYFHSVSLRDIQYYITSSIGNTCGVKTTSGNKLVAIPSFSSSYNIPYLTPFELTAPTAVDSVADTLITYCWEEWDLGGLNLGASLEDTHQYGPIFRSYPPSKSPTRVFPKDTMVLAGILSNAGKEDNQGEKVPDVARILRFRLTVRDIFNGNGCFVTPDDSVVLNAINTGRGFTVTSQNDSGATFIGGNSQLITWDVANTSTGVVNTPNVDIYMSDDGGYTWKYHVGKFPNTGSVTTPLPNPPSDIAAARIKVKGSNNVFFNVNKYNFGVIHCDNCDTTIAIYPVPAHDRLRIFTGAQGQQQFAIYDMAGKLMYRDVVYGVYDIPVNFWPRGMYLVRMVASNGHKTVKKFVVE